MSLPSQKTKTYGVRASMADLARSFAALAQLVVSSDWFSNDAVKLTDARPKKRRVTLTRSFSS